MKSNLPEMVRENNNVFDDNIAFIKEYDFSRANSSHEARLNAVTTVASICYQAPDKIGSEGLYDRLANEDIGIPSSSFAFIPVLISNDKWVEFLLEEDFNHIDCLYDTKTFGEEIEYNEQWYLLTNLRALLQDLGWTTDFKKAQELSEKYFNTSEEDIEIIKKFYKVYKVKMDIATSKQWNRHNFHLQELSRRYVSGKKVPFDFYVDEKMQKVTSINDITEYTGNYTTQEVIDICMNHYYSALEQGVKPQDARRIIPQGAYTEIWTGMMPRVLDNMLKLRTKPKTQWEFRQLALQIAEWEDWSDN
jgi:thymidylate synthase (FAD)